MNNQPACILVAEEVSVRLFRPEFIESERHPQADHSLSTAGTNSCSDASWEIGIDRESDLRDIAILGYN